MKGLILQKDGRWYTDMNTPFEKVSELSERYNWLVTNPENCYEKESLRRVFEREIQWYTGPELKTLLEQEKAQWIWGVFSGFPQNISKEEVLRYPVPWANDYEGYWKNPLTIQHPLAEVEITAWDSTLTLFISRNERLLKKFAALYPACEDLETYNAQP